MRDNCLDRNEPSYYLSNVEWSSLKQYAQKQQIQTQQFGVSYSCISTYRTHIHMHIRIIVKEKEGEKGTEKVT